MAISLLELMALLDEWASGLVLPAAALIGGLWFLVLQVARGLARRRRLAAAF